MANTINYLEELLKGVVLDGEHEATITSIAKEGAESYRFTFTLKTGEVKYLDRMIDKEFIDKSGELKTMNEVKSTLVGIANALQSKDDPTGKSIIVVIKGGFIQGFKSCKSTTTKSLDL